MTKFVLKPYFQPQSSNAPSSTATTSEDSASSAVPGQTRSTAPQDTVADPLWKRPSQLSLDVYISTTPLPGQVLGLDVGPDVNLAHLRWDNIEWGDWKAERNWTGDIRLPSVRAIIFYGVSFFLSSSYALTTYDEIDR